MKNILLVLSFVLTMHCSAVLAEQSSSFGDYVVHYNALIEEPCTLASGVEAKGQDFGQVLLFQPCLDGLEKGIQPLPRDGGNRETTIPLRPAHYGVAIFVAEPVDLVPDFQNRDIF